MRAVPARLPDRPLGSAAGQPHRTRGAFRPPRRRMSAWGAIAGGFAGTLLLTTALRAANELKLTRMDLPFLLGTAFSTDRTRAKALGYLLHFLAGTVFGLVHGLFSGTALVNILLPLIHPRMGTPFTAAPSVALLEPPGFMMLNYGPRTPLSSLVAHVAYGTVVGGFISLAG